jgi:hypothetical protein
MPTIKIYHYEATIEWTPYEGEFAGQVCGNPYWFDSMQSDPIKAAIDETIKQRNANLDPSVYIVGAMSIGETWDLRPILNDVLKKRS